MEHDVPSILSSFRTTQQERDTAGEGTTCCVNLIIASEEVNFDKGTILNPILFTGQV